MNKQHLQNLLEMAKIAISTGRITDPDQMIAAAMSMKAAQAMLDTMQEGQVLTISTVKPAQPMSPEKKMAIKREFAKAGAKAGETANDKTE